MEGKMNQYLEHYISNKITPVKQDISDLEEHFHRRIALYKTLGVPPLLFQDKIVLEVGPGGGYNPLVTQSLKLKQYDLVEPNNYAIDNINSIFQKYSIDASNINIYNLMLENFSTTIKYDIIICEGMVHGLHNKNEILKKFDYLLKPNGILIITCIDEIAYLFEILRYFIASKLVTNKNTFDEKLDTFEEAFTSHLNTLKGMSRFKRDWCADNLMGTMHFNYNFSFKESIEFFKNKYTFYNSSPNMFTEYRWYKEVPNELSLYNEYFLEQFSKKRHNLLHYEVIEKDRKAELNNDLVALCKEIFEYIEDSVINKKDRDKDISSVLSKICDNISGFSIQNSIAYKAIREINELIMNQQYTVDVVANQYENFQRSFGRGAFYISMIKEVTNAEK